MATRREDPVGLHSFKDRKKALVGQGCCFTGRICGPVSCSLLAQ